MITEIQSAIAGLKSAAEIAKVVYSAKLDADTKEKVVALQELIFEARQSAFNAQNDLATVKQRVTDLEAQIAEFEQWGKESQRYKLFNPQGVNGVVFGLKESESNSEPPHYLCTNCYQQRRKSFLYTYKHPDATRSAFLCSACKAQVPVEAKGHVVPTFAPD